MTKLQVHVVPVVWMTTHIISKEGQTWVRIMGVRGTVIKNQVRFIGLGGQLNFKCAHQPLLIGDHRQRILFIVLCQNRRSSAVCAASS